MDEFAIRAVHPLMVVADDLDPGNLKQPGGRKKVGSAAELAAHLDAGPLSRKDLKELTGYSGGTFDRRLDEAESAGLVTSICGQWTRKTDQP